MKKAPPENSTNTHPGDEKERERERESSTQHRHIHNAKHKLIFSYAMCSEMEILFHDGRLASWR